MAAIPKSTLISTLALVGIGFAAVIAMLIFAFSILNRQGGDGTVTPTGTQIDFPTPTPDYFPNDPILTSTPEGGEEAPVNEELGNDFPE